MTFIADILANDAVDLAVKPKLTESVVVSTDEGGRRTVEHVDDAAKHWVA
ncbi:phage tail protein [Burkholderia pyrrocinia]